MFLLHQRQLNFDNSVLINIPVVILHEQAHQMGYADEGEATL